MSGGVRLEHRLILASWFAAELGYSGPEEMLEALKNFSGEWESDGHPALGVILRGESWRTDGKIGEAALRAYDRGIEGDLLRVNRARGSGRFALKYFQYLALLASEHFLARREAPLALAAALNDFRLGGVPARPWPEYRDAADLDKLALWMATGSGKTLLMHLHYRQFFRRGVFSPDHVILLTPNEDLSAQHLREMRESGIPCFRHGEEGLFGGRKNAVRVLECAKLRVGKKPGRGATEGTESFEGRNLVFADEGHKGSGGNVFMEARRTLARGGFCFEYSATFGQALYAAASEELAAEYGRAIALDYSYKHFHRNGYGKDFRVLNLAGEPPEDKTDAVMLGNLLSFCQQRMLYADNGQALADYNLEPPLLLLLGTTVTGGKKEAESDTDLAKLLVFLHRVAMDNGGPLTRAAGAILRGESGIPAKSGADAFAGRLEFLRRECGDDGAAALAKLREVVFHSPGAAALQLRLMKSAPGEIGLAAGGDNPFGLAYVGNPGKLRELTQKRGKAEGLEIEAMDDSLGDSLFAGINRPRSPVNVLIGAKKFMEGWSSWRVSGMGLLNVGATEGSQIIQLFGRGVRLKGREMSLRRSSSDSGGKHPKALAPLETLNIFGSRANFVARFREYLEREGVAGELLEIPIEPSGPLFEGENLLVPKFPPAGDFRDAVAMSAKAERFKIALDHSTRTHVVEGGGDDWETRAAAAAGQRNKFDDKVIAALDLGELRRRLTERKTRAGLFNLLIPGGELAEILRERCRVQSPDFGPPKSFADAGKLNDIAFAALWKFAETLHRIRRKRWETREMKYGALERESGNFQPHYTVRAANEKVAEAIRKLLNDCERLYRPMTPRGGPPLPRFYFDRHLYQPLLTEGGDAEVLFPPALNDGERDFVESLQEWLKPPSGAPAGEYFLLRNLSRGKGAGFFTEAGFYPDFILWIKRGGGQRIVFIEPHGLLLDKHPDANPKARLFEKLAEISAVLNQTPKWRNVRMDSFVISQTDQGALEEKWGGEWTEEKFLQRHIIFPKPDHSHIAEILRDPE